MEEGNGELEGFDGELEGFDGEEEGGSVGIEELGGFSGEKEEEDDELEESDGGKDELGGEKKEGSGELEESGGSDGGNVGLVELEGEKENGIVELEELGGLGGEKEELGGNKEELGVESEKPEGLVSVGRGEESEREKEGSVQLENSAGEPRGGESDGREELGGEKERSVKLGKLGGLIGEKRSAESDGREDLGGEKDRNVELGKVGGLVGEEREAESDGREELVGEKDSNVELGKVGGLVGEKRGAESDGREKIGGNKKARGDMGEELKKVAEIVLVLSTMGKMRGGRSPTEYEKELMDEARGKLVDLCEEIPPKDVVSKEAVRVVIEELGLSRSKEQRLGFRPPVVSIKEKVELTTRKMEESKKFAAQSGAYSSQMLQGGFGTQVESHGTFLHAVNRYPPDRATAGSTPMVHVSTPASTSSSNLLPVNDGHSAAIYRIPPGGSLGRDSSSLPLPRTETGHFRLDGRSNMSAYASQFRGNSSGDRLPEKTATSSQLQSGAVAKHGLVNKMPDHVAEGAPTINTSQLGQATRDRNSKSSGVQTAYANLRSAHQPSQAMYIMQASSSSHNDIAKLVQQFLHPMLPPRRDWTPPSTDYMSKSLNCQICRVIMSDAENLVICDACENGVHLKCLHVYNQKGVPKAEWHCPRCLMINSGKPFPPKYGRVTRSIVAPKVPSNQKVTANGNPGSLCPVSVGRPGNNHIVAASGLRQSNAREVEGAKVSESKMKMADNRLSEHKLLPKDTTICVPPLYGSPNKSSNQQVQNNESFKRKLDESILENKPDQFRLDRSFDTGITSVHNPQTSLTSQEAGKTVQQKSLDTPGIQNHVVKNYDLRDASECKLGNNVRKDDRDIAQTNSVEAVAAGNGARDCLKSSSGGLHSVVWVGEHQIADEKAYYKSCEVNGMVYKLQDHALFCSNNGNLRPSKIQALWEDTKTGSRWAMVNSCYFPADLPEAVGQPCSPENNEVYVSNHGSTVRAGLIQGPSDVLPPTKFKEEIERRRHLNGTTSEMRPIYLCKWFYDESKGIFRPVNE